MMNLFVVLALTVQLLATSIKAEIVNKEVVRTIDATTSMLKISTELKVSSSGDAQYTYMLPNSQAERLAYIGVKAKGKKTLLSVSAPVEEYGNYTSYKVDLPAGEQSPTIKVVVVLTGLLEPFPAEIYQNEKQFVKLQDSHYYFSKYPTKTQKTSIKLASSNVESYTRKVPHTNRGSAIGLGPYTDVEAYSWSPCTVHSQNHEPFAKLSTVDVDMEVSHWGSISVEEVVELQHAGAKLKGGFSRFQYQMRQQENSHGFNTLLAVLPGQSSDIFYRDQIGNVSSSELRRIEEDMELEIQPRFPLFGGWKTQFYIGYKVPTESMLSIDADTGRYRLSFDFYTAFEDVWVEQMEMKVVLPEGCTDVKVELPAGVSSSWTRRFTYLDSQLNGGRPVLILRGNNLVSELASEVIVTYEFSATRMLVEPLMLVGSFLCVFLFFTFSSRESTKDKK